MGGLGTYPVRIRIEQLYFLKALDPYCQLTLWRGPFYSLPSSPCHPLGGAGLLIFASLSEK